MTRHAPPDTILTNARIRTMDPARPVAQALAIRQGRVLALGTDADIRALAGPHTARIDAGGRPVLPGFQDAHIHLLSGGLDLTVSAQLYHATTLDHIVALVSAQAARWSGGLVMATGWQAGLFGAENLTARVLDRAVPDRPCIAVDSSAHNACLNSAAARMVGMVRGMDDPPNGHVVRGADGEPTGMLYEDAVLWALARLPQPSAADWRAGLRAGQAHANAHGITGIMDAKLEDDTYVAAYANLAAEGALTVHASGAAWVRPDDTAASALARLTALRAAHPGPDFTVPTAKFFFDGVLESYTAAMLSPFADTGGNAPVMFAPGQIAEIFAALDAARFQIHVHVIGDAAARAALDGLAHARVVNGRWPSRHQLAHLQVMHPDDIPRIAALGAMANIQPLWARHDPVVPDLWMATVGAERLPLTYAFRWMLDSGADWCLSSDWPVTTLNPFEIIETAVTRQPRGGVTPPFLPDERLTVAEAVEGYTTRAAAACWRDGDTGMLRPGYSADLIVLDRDILTVPLDEIGGTEVLLTLFKGQPVHRAPGFDG